MGPAQAITPPRVTPLAGHTQSETPTHILLLILPRVRYLCTTPSSPWEDDRMAGTFVVPLAPMAQSTSAPHQPPALPGLELAKREARGRNGG